MNKRFKIGSLLIAATSLLIFSAFSQATKGDEYSVKVASSYAKWKATKTGGSHEGTVDIKSGKLTLDGDLITSGTIVMDMTSIKLTDTESKKLHDHLHSPDFFNTAQFKESKLDITSSKMVGDKLEISGNITIKGITKPVTFQASKTGSNDNARVYRADVKIDRTLYGITYKSGVLGEVGDGLIDDIFTIETKLYITK
ncbi:MAG: YceI family protein [Flavobacteriales bacterium]|nr:YceI family protein [Flavobacteriales bacterium]